MNTAYVIQSVIISLILMILIIKEKKIPSIILSIVLLLTIIYNEVGTRVLLEKSARVNKNALIEISTEIKNGNHNTIMESIDKTIEENPGLNSYIGGGVMQKITADRNLKRRQQKLKNIEP